jgi:hypothetical protein
MLDAGTRAAILDRFTRKLRPLLRQGFLIEVVAHSWGTVVAYEGMRQLDADPTLPNGAVRDFFTCGAALSIPAVRWNLFGRVGDGRRPRLVRRWINLNARGDLVGGSLKDRGYAVHDDFVNLPTVVCRPFPPDPVCAHASYFRAENLRVNQGIMGALVG